MIFRVFNVEVFFFFFFFFSLFFFEIFVNTRRGPKTPIKKHQRQISSVVGGVVRCILQVVHVSNPSCSAKTYSLVEVVVFCDAHDDNNAFFETFFTTFGDDDDDDATRTTTHRRIRSHTSTVVSSCQKCELSSSSWFDDVCDAESRRWW